ncbi:MAG: Ig-like domain-containing protein [Candidatus Poribacteria bacterium]|nr:Ig-like domain-containing protein [Candidatus Poribacteria bacterium]
MRSIFLIFAIFTCIYGCSTETDNGKSEPLFTAPVEIDQPKPADDPSVFTPIQPIVEPEPEDVKVPDRVFDIFAPKLVESSVSDGERNVDIHLNDITLTFDEDIAKSNIQILNAIKTSLRWKRIINGKNVVFTPLGNVIDLRADQQYQISGIVEDAAGNARAILITFTTEKRDKTSPVFLRTTIRHGDFGVDPNTDNFTFGFNEDIGDVRISIKNRNTGRDLRWTHVIRGKEVVLHKLDKGLSLQGGVVYRINIAWADESGNWDQGGIIDFTTEIKE